MSLLTETKSVVGDFQYLNVDALQVRTLNTAKLYNFAGGNSGDVLTWNEPLNQWEPLPGVAANVIVTPVINNAEYYPTFAPTDQGTVPLNTNLKLTFNPGAQVLTVPYVNGTAAAAVDSLNSLNVNVTDDNTTNSTLYPTFVLNNSGNNNVRVDSAHLTYNPVSNVLSSSLFSGSLINVVTINGAPYPPPLPSAIPTGNTLTVDEKYGNDALAALNRYAVAFKTIGAALALAAAGENVRVNAGVYTLAAGLTIPAGVSLTGAGTQCVVLDMPGVAASTTLITMGSNTRVENVTGNLSSANNVALTGVNFPSTTSINAKLRSVVINVTSSAVGANAITGVLSAGTSTLTFASSDAIARSTVNVTSSSTGVTRGLLVQNDNRIGIRETVINATGTGSNIIGVETYGVGIVVPYVTLKTSTVRGSLADVSRTAGTLLVGSTDFVNTTANGNSFSTFVVGINIVFAVIGNLGNNKVHYLVPGSFQQNNLPSAPLLIPITQNTILISSSISYTENVAAPKQIYADVYKSTDLVTPVYTITLSAGTVVTLTTKSVDFAQGDLYFVTVTTVGNTWNGTFSLTLTFY